jgi:predicted CoA-binding protein
MWRAGASGSTREYVRLIEEVTMLSDNEIRDALLGARTIAMVGISDRPERDSFAVARFLQRNGYRVLPVNPRLSGRVLGEQPYASLRDITEHVDIVDVFRRPEHLPQIVEDALAIGAGMVWAQLGITNPAAARRAQQAGLRLVMDRCMAIEHRRLMRMVESVLY